MVHCVRQRVGVPVRRPCVRTAVTDGRVENRIEGLCGHAFCHCQREDTVTAVNRFVRTDILTRFADCAAAPYKGLPGLYLTAFRLTVRRAEIDNIHVDTVSTRRRHFDGVADDRVLEYFGNAVERYRVARTEVVMSRGDNTVGCVAG